MLMTRTRGRDFECHRSPSFTRPGSPKCTRFVCAIKASRHIVVQPVAGFLLRKPSAGAMGWRRFAWRSFDTRATAHSGRLVPHRATKNFFKPHGLSPINDRFPKLDEPRMIQAGDHRVMDEAYLEQTTSFFTALMSQPRLTESKSYLFRSTEGASSPRRFFVTLRTT